MSAVGQLTATVYPPNATNKSLSWSSGDDGIVTVDSSGNVEAVDVGTTTITVKTTDGGYTDECTILVVWACGFNAIEVNNEMIWAGDNEYDVFDNVSVDGTLLYADDLPIEEIYINNEVIQ